MLYIKCLLILSLIFNPMAYADDEDVTIPTEVARDTLNKFYKMKDRNAELEVTNEHLQNANWGLIKSSQLLKEEIERRDLLESPDPGVSPILWFVIGIAAGGAAGYFGAKELRK